MNREFLPIILEGILFYESVIFILIKQLAMRILKLIHGGLAQLGERLAGSQKVVGSIPIVSTIFIHFKLLSIQEFFCCFQNMEMQYKVSIKTNNYIKQTELNCLFPSISLN